MSSLGPAGWPGTAGAVRYVTGSKYETDSRRSISGETTKQMANLIRKTAHRTAGEEEGGRVSGTPASQGRHGQAPGHGLWEPQPWLQSGNPLEEEAHIRHHG